MGLLFNIGTAVKKSVVGKALDFLTVGFNRPIATATSLIQGKGAYEKLVETEFNKPLGKQITGTVISTAGYAAAILTAGAAAGAAKAGTLATSVKAMVPKLLPSTLKGKVIAAVAAPVVIGAVASNPLKAVNVAASTPSKLANVGYNLAELGANPSIDNLKTLVKENPLIVGGAALVGGAAIIKTAAPVVSNVLLREEMKDQTAIFERQAKAAESSLKVVDKSGLFVQDVPKTSALPSVTNTQPMPKTPETSTISSGTPRRRSSRPKAKPQNISQRVNVVVSSRNYNVGIKSNRKYLNERILN